jgi:hypothetical protein
MTRRRTLTLVVIATVALLLGRFASEPATPSTTDRARTQGIAPAAPRRSDQATPPPRAAERSHLADQLNAPAGTARDDLAVLQEVLLAFRSNFPRSGNPTGSNADITAALTGHNKLDLALIPPDHPAINRDGELCDRWGTPFFFHAESGTRMTTRSAGPDRKMWTADDEEIAP